jgi:type II secretory pathway component PulM
MNVLIIILMGLIVVLLVVITFTLLRIPGERVERDNEVGESLREMVERMEDREQTERNLRTAASDEKQRKHQMVLNPLAGLSDGDERIHQTNMKAEKILIPENLSAEERQVLKEFFDL